MSRDPSIRGWQGKELAQLIQRLATACHPSTVRPATGAVELLEPLWRAVLEEVLRAEVLHLDTTGLPVVDDSDDSKVDRPGLGSLWGFIGDARTAFYLYSPTEQAQFEQGPGALLARRRGYVVAGASCHFATALWQPSVVHCGCNLQAYRLFYKARESGDSRSINPLNFFRHLYKVEEELHGCAPEVKRARRQAQSRRGYDDLVDACREWRPGEPLASPLARAIHYVLEHEAALRRFLDDGTLPIDNSVFEHLPVHTALARGPLVFSSHEEGQRAAIACTLVSCCQLSDIDPLEYLLDVLPRLSHGVPQARIAELLPSRWKPSSRLGVTEPGLEA